MLTLLFVVLFSIYILYTQTLKPNRTFVGFQIDGNFDKCATLSLSNIQQICSRHFFNESGVIKTNENIVAKGETAYKKQFLLLPQWFQMSSAADVSTHWKGLLITTILLDLTRW